MANETMTRDEAIARLVEMDVAKFGEGERAASQKSHAGRSDFLALNELANRYDLEGNKAEAKRIRAMAPGKTKSDKKSLRYGRDGG